MSRTKINQTLELIWVRATLNLRSEASVNNLSYAWWIIEPLLHMSVYYLVFSLLLNRGGENYIAFLLTGLVPWLWFSKTISSTTGSILKGQKLMNQLHVPKIFFPSTIIVQNSIKQVFVFFLLFVFIIGFGLHPSIAWMNLFPVIFIQFMLILSCSLLAALSVAFVRDMSLIIPTALQFMMFCSGIFYSHNDIPTDMQAIFFSNPMAVILASYRKILVENVNPDWFLLGYVAILSLGLLALSLALYKKYEYILPRVVSE